MTTLLLDLFQHLKHLSSRHFYKRRSLFLLGFLLLSAASFGQLDSQMIAENVRLGRAHFDSNRVEKVLEVATNLDQLFTKKEGAEYAKVNYLFGLYWYKKLEYEKAISYCTKAINQWSPTTDQLLLAEPYIFAAAAYRRTHRFEKAFASFQKAAYIKTQMLGAEHYDVARIYHDMGAVKMNAYQLEEALTYLNKGMDITKKNFGEDTKFLNKYYLNIGLCHLDLYQHETALSYFNKSLELCLKNFGSNHLQTAYAYANLAQAAFEGSDHKKALDYLKKALYIRENSTPRNEFAIALLHYKIGDNQLHLSKFNESIRSFEKASKYSRDHLFNSEVLRSKAQASAELGKLKTAEEYFQSAIHEIQRKPGDDGYYTYMVYLTWANSLMDESKYPKALNLLEKALSISTQIYDDRSNELFDLLLLKGTCHFHLNDRVEALRYFDKARQINGMILKKEAATLNQLTSDLLLNSEYAKILIQQIEEGEEELLLEADSVLRRAIDFTDYIRKNYQSRASKESLVADYFDIYQNAIKIKFLLFEKKQDKKFVEAAFHLSEKSKNLTLLETLRQASAFSITNISDTLLNQEKELKSNIIFLEKQLYETQLQQPNDKKTVGQLHSDLFDLKQTYQQILSKIEETYPQYYQLKYEPKQVSISSIQRNIIGKNQSLLEYFVGDSLIYVFLITKKDFKTFTLPKSNNLGEKIAHFRQAIYSYRPTYLESNDSLLLIANHLGQTLYKELLASFQSALTQKIIIVADGAISYLPFDALQKEGTTNASNPTFLLEDHIISHAYSANWLSQVITKKATHFDQAFLGIAPNFKDENNAPDDVYAFRVGLGALKHNKEEVQNINEIIGGKVLVDHQATRTNFINSLKGNQIVHLATHGKSNDTQGDFSYLAFSASADTTESRFLYVRDFFNLSIPADLVVLSACETGLGEIKNGEGIIGIGKGFSYAGAKSLVTTLWRVNDNTTARFMPIFYQNLKKGLSKDEALWHAKKEFIRTSRDQHPFFWSGYVAFGDMRPINFSNDGHLLFWIGGGLLMLLVSLFFMKKI